MLSNESELVVKLLHVARVIDSLLRWCAVLHASVVLACKVCGLRVASSVKALDAAIIYNHHHGSGEVVVVEKFSALPILEGC